MSNIFKEEEKDQLSPLQRAVVALKEMRSKLDAIEKERSEPIAIIGMGCRFPGGVEAPESFWQLCRNGVDATREVPQNRWNVQAYYDPNPKTPGKMYTRRGGFLERIDEFDADFFGISPREAISIDPQQRLLLEVSYSALENAGQAIDKLKGSQSGVFVGISAQDYAYLSETTDIDVYTATGNAPSIAAGRLSYFLGLEGPSLAVDTACSSSLVAVHLACQSLRAGECNLALAGGVHLMLSPQATISMAKMQALAPDGRCKTFNADADGYARGEGCGVIVLKPLSKAIVDSDNILAVIRGSAINQDGRSSALTVPNGQAQRSLLREAVANSKVKPQQISYVEAHGTGTPLGDPIEVKALAEVLGEGRTEAEPLAIGSVKTNIGHLEAAAGIAGLIKVVLAMEHQEIPPHLHLNQLNPHISLENTSITIPTTTKSWQTQGELRIAGVSSFGFGGTNAHVVLEEREQGAGSREQGIEEDSLNLLTLSAKSETALQKLANQFASYLETHPSESLADICFTANSGRSHFNHRLAVVGKTSSQLHQQLADFTSEKYSEGLTIGLVSPIKKPKVAFLFTGQGSQYIGMGRQLYETQPVFRQTLEQCEEILASELEQPLLSVLYTEERIALPLNQTAYTQPALFAIEYSLAQLWRSWGIEPQAVMGHSVGEYVAACVAGVFTLEEGLKLVAARGRLMQALPTDGKMVAVFASEVEVSAVLATCGEEVALAALNSPQNTVISGDRTAIENVVSKIEAAGIDTKYLQVNQAFHSPAVEPMLEAFMEEAGKVNYSLPEIDFVSNLSGQLVREEVTTSEYWCRHVREPVRFTNGVKALANQGYEIFLEIGPHPVLIGMGKSCLAPGKGTWLSSLHRKQENWSVILASLAELYVQGFEVNWSEFAGNELHRRLPLPTYPFEREGYWRSNRSLQPRRNSSPEIAHPLLDQKLRSPLAQIQFESQVDLDDLPLVKDHQLAGMPVMNLVVYLEIALAGAVEAFGKNHYLLEDVFVPQALLLSSETTTTVQLILTPEDSAKASFTIFSQENEQELWKMHATGKLSWEEAIAPNQKSESKFETNPEKYPNKLSQTEFYQMMSERGADLGSSCQLLEQIWCCEGEALGKIAVISETDNNYHLPLSLIDASFQLLSASFFTQTTQGWAITGFESFQFNNIQEQEEFWCRATLHPDNNYQDSKTTILGDVYLLNKAGQVVAEVTEVQLKCLNYQALQRTSQKAITRKKISIPPSQILAATSEERQHLLETYLLEVLASSLQQPIAKLNSQQNLAVLLDSLMAFEVKNQIESDFKVQVPMEKLLGDSTISQLTDLLLKQLTLTSLMATNPESSNKEDTEEILI